MNSRGTLLPRVLALVLLLVSLSMLVPLGSAAIRLSGGATLLAHLWLWPLILLAIGVVLTYLLSRRTLAFRVYAIAFVLWLITAGYYWLRIVRL